MNANDVYLVETWYAAQVAWPSITRADWDVVLTAMLRRGGVSRRDFADVFIVEMTERLGPAASPAGGGRGKPRGEPRFPGAKS